MAKIVTHTIANLSGGVTQAFDEQASEIQVREMINCLPTISKGVFRRNPINGEQLITTFNTNDYYVYSYDRGTDDDKYTIMIGKGQWLVFNAITNDLVASGTSSYLNIPLGVTPEEAFSVVTVRDFTFICNKYVKVATNGVVEGTLDSHKKTGIYWIKQTSQNTVEASNEPRIIDNRIYDQAKNGLLIEGYSYVLNGQLVQAKKDTRWDGTIDILRGDQIATELKTLLGIAYTASNAFVYKTNMGVNDAWEWGDSNGNNASFGFKGIVERPDMLPDKLPAALNGLLVNISQSTESTLDDYWLKYSGATWLEDKKPGMVNTLLETTMPHVLVRGSNGAFSFTTFTESSLNALGITNSAVPYGWKQRTVGDEKTCPLPSFVDNYITQVFFHKNRLGFISRDNIILSENNDLGNFFGTSVRYLPETDPIDITVATQEVSYLNSVISTNNALIMFSNKAQYILHSGNGALTPSSATIDVASKYSNNPKCMPKALGNKIYFIDETAGYSQMYLYNVTEGVANTEAMNVSEHIPTYLPKNISIIEGNSNLGYVFLWSVDTPSTIYVFSQNISNNKINQASWHKWIMPANGVITGMNIIDNSLKVILRSATEYLYYACDISLEIPSDYNTIIYEDTIDDFTAPYESTIEFSKWLIKDNNGQGSKDGRLQIRTISYSLYGSSYYKTSIVTDSGTLSEAMENTWNDTMVWSDTDTFNDGNSIYAITLANQERVLVMGNSKDTLIVFQNDTDNNPTKGFNLSTITYEGTYHIRGQRY